MVRYGIAGTIGADQGERHAVDAGVGFARVLNAVVVGIIPHEVANGHRLVEAEIDGVIDETLAAGGDTGLDVVRPHSHTVRIDARIRTRASRGGD